MFAAAKGVQEYTDGGVRPSAQRILVDDKRMTSAAALWEIYQDQFPVREHLIYMNHAAVTPLCRPASDAMKHLADDQAWFGSVHYDQWLAIYAGLRR